jgi:Rrf2 family protein
MNLTQATDNAFRAVLYLAKLPPGQVVDAQTIAKSEDIPLRFLLKIMHILSKQGFVKSFRGVGGGFALAKEAENITLLDIVQAMEGPVVINRCLSKEDSYCSPTHNNCVVHDELWSIQKILVTKLSAVNFAYLAKKTQS